MQSVADALGKINDALDKFADDVNNITDDVGKKQPIRLKILKRQVKSKETKGEIIKKIVFRMSIFLVPFVLKL